MMGDMTDTNSAQSAFDRGDGIVVDIKAQFPEKVVCEAALVIPDPNVTGVIRPMEDTECQA